MPARRLLMRKIREVLQLRHEQGLSHQAVARACGVGVGTVNRYLRRAAQCGLGWPLPAELDDGALEARLFPRAAPVRDRVRPLCGVPHRGRYAQFGTMRSRLRVRSQVPVRTRVA